MQYYFCSALYVCSLTHQDWINLGLGGFEVVIEHNAWCIALVGTTSNPTVFQREAGVAKLILFFIVVLAYYYANN